MIASEYDRLFGVEGIYTHAKAHSLLGVMPPLSPYAALVKDLHEMVRIEVYKTDNPTINGFIPEKFYFQEI